VECEAVTPQAKPSLIRARLWARARGSPAREVPLAREASGLLLHRATSPGWAFAHVCDGVVIGEDCNLYDHTFFEKGVRLGNRITIK